MKKVLSLLLALFMVLSLCVTAFAADTVEHVITINNNSENQAHTYEAYQIFAGDYDKTSGKLSNIVWGTGVDTTKKVNEKTLLEALKADTKFEVTKDSTTKNLFADCTTAADVAKVLGSTDFTEAMAKEFADVVADYLSSTVAGTSVATKTTVDNVEKEGSPYTIDVTGDGYYLIKDKDTTVTAEGDTYTDYMLQVVGDVTVTAKSSAVTVEKKVATGGYACGKEAGKYYDADGNVSDTEKDGYTLHTHSSDCGYEYADDNTAQVGDVVSYKIESKIPAEAAEYDYYYFIFGDTLSSGLDFVSTSVKVTIGGDDAVKDTDYTVSTSYKTYTFAVALKDAKANAGETVVLTYNATVNENAVVGAGGNKNTVEVKFSRDPNVSWDGKTKPSDGFPEDGSVEPDGVTPKDITKTYVTKMTILKVDGSTKKALEGAIFTITGTTKPVYIKSEDIFKESVDGTYYKLTNGSYTTTDPQAEAMVEITDGTRTGGYVIETDKTKADYEFVVSGTTTYYREATDTELADATITLYKHMASNESLYASTTTKYTKTRETTTTYCAAEEFSYTGTTNSDGKLVLSGLNAGTYTITELKAPDGYNLLKEPHTVDITCDLPTSISDGEETCTWKYVVDDVNATAESDGTIKITIENNSGAELPSTGGIGTTIFYVLGGVLVLGAAVLLITRKRVGEEK